MRGGKVGECGLWRKEIRCGWRTDKGKYKTENKPRGEWEESKSKLTRKWLMKDEMRTWP